ncbi:MAG: winged helix-turn-helix domain-containing protein [Nitrososphaeraceae archaeon]
MIYRSRPEIVALILEAANGGATRTKIMYKAFFIIRSLERISFCAIGK